MAPTILITRPEPAAAALADAIGVELGPEVPILRAPLMRIEVLSPSLPLDGVTRLIFTSRHGVEGFTRLNTRRDIPGIAIGPATAAVARAAGLRVDEGPGDAAGLAARLAGEGGDAARCLYLRGRHVAADLAAELRARGIPCAEAVVYDQVAQPLSGTARALLSGTAPVVAPLLSPRSARLLGEAAPFAAPVCVAALSERVAQALPPGTARLTQVAERPDLPALMRLLPGLHDAAKQLERGKRAQ